MTTPLPQQIKRVSEIYPDPTIDSRGKPTDPGTGGGWIPTSTTRENWGTLRVVVGGTDMTLFRDVATQIESWGSAEPLGDTTARIRFPQIHPFEALGTGALANVNDFADVEIKRLHPDGTTLSTLWEGFISSFEDADGLRIICTGALHQVGLYVRAPGISDAELDIAALIDNEFSLTNRPAGRWVAPSSTATGITSRQKGAWEPPTNSIARWLDAAYTSTGEQVTVNHARPRTPVVELKDMTTETWTAHVGQPGVKAELAKDLTGSPNVAYIEGTDPAGARFRNSFPDQPAGFPHYQPGAYALEVHGYDEDASGDLVDNTARVDPDVFRIETHIDYGEGFTLAEAKTLAERQMALRQPSVLGDIHWDADPHEGSRLEMRAGASGGGNVRLRGYRGAAAGILAHIAQVDVVKQGDGYRVTTVVDELGRDAALIAMIRKHQDEAAKDPAGRLLVGKDSGSTKDAQVPWDGEGGSGWVPNDATNGHRHINGTSTVSLTANTWKVVKILASQKDTIAYTEFTTSPATAFHLSVYDEFVATGDLPSDPFADGAWDSPTVSPIIGWGAYGQAAGYHPGLESEGDAVTGVLRWEDTWQYNHDDTTDRENLPYLYLAIRAKGTCTIHGRFIRGVGYGE